MLGRSKPEAFEHRRHLKGQRVDNKGKQSSGWKIQDSFLQSLITAEEGAGTNTDVQNSKDLGGNDPGEAIVNVTKRVLSE